MTADCNECVAMIHREGPSLWGACASVGTEHAMSTDEMMRAYVTIYHDMGHPEKAIQPSEGTRPR